MKVTITHLKAPWPAGAGVGDVVDLEAAEVPAWALGKCKQADEDAEVFSPPAAGPTAEEVEAQVAAEAKAAEDAQIAATLEAERVAGEAQVAAEAKAALLIEAKALGITVQQKWSDERLAAEVQKAKAAKA